MTYVSPSPPARRCLISSRAVLANGSASQNRDQFSAGLEAASPEAELHPASATIASANPHVADLKGFIGQAPLRERNLCLKRATRGTCAVKESDFARWDRCLPRTDYPGLHVLVRRALMASQIP